MAAHQEVFVIIDANIFLHFRQPDEIDWLRLADAAQVFLVIYPVLLTEIEKAKIQHHLKTIRDRASQRIKWLERFLANPSENVRPFVTAHVDASEPIDVMRNLGLDRTIKDDLILATALAYQTSGKQVLVVSADGGLRLKLTSRNLPTLCPPDNLQLAAEPDKLKLELESTRRALSELQNRQPKLLLKDNAETHLLSYVPDVPDKDSWAKNATRQDTDRARRQAGADNVFPNSLAATFFARDYSPQSIKRLEAYYAQVFEYFVCQAQTTVIRISLTNTGTIPANNVRVLLKLPSGLECYHPRDLPSKPTRPGLDDFGGSYLTRALDYPATRQTKTGPSISEDGQVQLWVLRVQHHNQEELNPLAIRVLHVDNSEPFEVAVTIYADELPNPTFDIIKLYLEKPTNVSVALGRRNIT